MAHEVTRERPPEPPHGPAIRRRVTFYRSQAIGMLLVSVFPLLALFKVFDTTRANVIQSASGLQLAVHYPSRMRDRTSDPLVIEVGNETGSNLDRIEVRIDRAYLDRFDNATIEPTPTSGEPNAVVVSFDEVPDGDRRTVTVAFESEEAGVFPAKVEARAGNRAVRANFQTLVFP